MILAIFFDQWACSSVHAMLLRLSTLPPECTVLLIWDDYRPDGQLLSKLTAAIYGTSGFAEYELPNLKLVVTAWPGSLESVLNPLRVQHMELRGTNLGASDWCDGASRLDVSKEEWDRIARRSGDNPLRALCAIGLDRAGEHAVVDSLDEAHNEMLQSVSNSPEAQAYEWRMALHCSAMLNFADAEDQRMANALGRAEKSLEWLWKLGLLRHHRDALYSVNVDPLRRFVCLAAIGEIDVHLFAPLFRIGPEGWARVAAHFIPTDLGAIWQHTWMAVESSDSQDEALSALLAMADHSWHTRSEQGATGWLDALYDLATVPGPLSSSGAIRIMELACAAHQSEKRTAARSARLLSILTGLLSHVRIEEAYDAQDLVLAAARTTEWAAGDRDHLFTSCCTVFDDTGRSLDDKSNDHDFVQRWIADSFEADRPLGLKPLCAIRDHLEQLLDATDDNTRDDGIVDQVKLLWVAAGSDLDDDVPVRAAKLISRAMRFADMSGTWLRDRATQQLQRIDLVEDDHATLIHVLAASN